MSEESPVYAYSVIKTEKLDPFLIKISLYMAIAFFGYFLFININNGLFGITSIVLLSLLSIFGAFFVKFNKADK